MSAQWHESIDDFEDYEEWYASVAKALEEREEDLHWTSSSRFGSIMFIGMLVLIAAVIVAQTWKALR